MLYVFHVETGTMMTFEMGLAVESVGNLKEYIEKVCKIAVDKQVLLINGGECLDSNLKVCQYSAGTDTNPIFLFNKSIIQSQTPPTASVDYGSDFGKKLSPCPKGLCCYAYCNDFTAKVYEAENMAPSFNTVEHRARLTQQFFDTDKEQTKVCERLVFDQHLQQQGWAAVVANLEDIAAEFKKRAEKFEKIFQDHIQEHDTYLESLKVFHDDLKILEQIPILSNLLENNEDFDSESGEHQRDEVTNKDEEQLESSTGSSSKKNVSLYEWISAADNGNSIDKLFEHCHYGLTQVNKAVFDRLHDEIDKVIQSSEQAELREIKGLSDRLCGLEQLMVESKRYVQSQQDYAASFQQNQIRCGNLKDPTLLPDLCIFHVPQLHSMLDNHTQICDIRRRCMKAKEELSVNLYHRLKWVMYVESKIQDTDHNLVICHENLKRLRCNLEVIQQIHSAPAMYMSAIAEVVRRRTFSQAFLLWASELACHLLTIHNDEVTRRKDFQSQFDGHFLNALFPGMSDLPPSFATQAPSIFDSSLPIITVDDIERLKTIIPDLTDTLTVPDLSGINFFMTKSIKNESDKVEDIGIEEKLVQVVSDVGLSSNFDKNLLKANESETCLATLPNITQIKEIDRGCESETDIEEFEKLCQSPLELNFDKEIQSDKPSTQDASTLTEVGEKNPTPPKKPPRTFQKSNTLPVYNNNNNISDTNNMSTYNVSLNSQRTLSISGSQSNTESFTNIKNPSLESIDELSSLRNFTSNTESCFNSHHQQILMNVNNHQHQTVTTIITASTTPATQAATTTTTNNITFRSKSLSPHTPQSPKDLQQHIEQFPNSPVGHQPNEFVNDEYYIDESLPSSLSIETGQSQGEFVRQLDTANNVVALLQDNLETSRTEQDRLKLTLTKVRELTKETTTQLRNELDNFKKYFVLERINLETQCESLNSSFESLCLEYGNKEREIVQRITVDHELEMSDYRKLIMEKCEEINLLKDNYLRLECKYRKSLEDVDYLKTTEDRLQTEKRLQNDEFQKKINDIGTDRDRSIKEATDILVRNHKVEMENLRAKFRLVTTPTDTDRLDLEAIKHKYDYDRQTLIDNETVKWKKILDGEIERLKNEFKQEKDVLMNDVARRISDEKDKQIELLRQRERNLTLEISKHKTTIEQLIETETQNPSDLIDKLETLERDKCQLEAELSQERSKRLTTTHASISTDMSASVAVCEGKVDAATSPKKHRDKLTRSQTSLVKCGKLSVDSCNKGDKILVIWDKDHQKYMILQDSVYLFFLNSDCLESLNLKDQNDDDRKMYCTCEVLEKEFCSARKSENRYNVPRGTKFYRVKVKPLTNPIACSSEESCATALTSSTVSTTIPSLTTTTTTTTNVTTIATTSSQMSQSQVVARTQHDIIASVYDASQSLSVPNTPTRTDVKFKDNNDDDDGDGDDDGYNNDVTNETATNDCNDR